MQPLRLLVESWGAGAATVRKDDLAAPIAADKAAPLVTQEAPSTEPLAESRAVQRVLRVDQSKIDAIMNLVAELIVAKNGLSYLASRAEKVHGSRAASREIKEQFTVIDRITQGLQVGVMSVRMMPVGQVFQRFPRLVRDIARKLGKKIELVVEGEDTEADKNVLESLSDPLIHMVRNSLDHGIETPDERRAAGKSEQGVVHITAHQENDNVVIEVRDDGKGIDTVAVKAKAVQLGLLTTEKAQQISDEEAANLVFAPGFSTKAEVSELSGRGVGMDVVRSAVLKAGGEVTLRTKFGVGTSVTVRLPLTMAVTRIVTIECRGRIFGIPMDLVVETVRLRRAQVHRIKSAETFVLRDAIIPLLRLADVMGLSQAEHEGQDGDEAVMVVRLGRDRIGLVVDGFRERMEVIVKPLEGVLEGMPGFSGTALLGDGGVLLIIDLQEMLRCQ
jgi:two-component system chemotaxis sensor kinase CheA